MTYDTDEDNNSTKLDIRCLEDDDAGGHWKRFFEKGLGALLADKYFLLLYVPKDGAKMRIIQPASDPYHRQQMIKRVNEASHIPSFYYALSHLWGITKDNPQLWEEIGDYVDDMDGQPASPVPMRPDKRATLLALLRAHPDSYWWIDVLCARTDTPLDIMGDIYSCCLECIAMIDCEPILLSKFDTDRNMREEIVDYYMIRNPSTEDVMRYKRLHAKYPQLKDQVCQLRQSEWWKRVWTWQEMALPYGDVRLIAETDDGHFQTNTTTMDELINSFKNVFEILVYLAVADDTEEPKYNNSFVDKNFDFMLEIYHARTFNKHRIGKKSPSSFAFLIGTLGASDRRCMDPVDYVYGVLGMFQFKIPRMNDPTAVWQRFVAELEKYIEDMRGGRFEIADDKYQITAFNDRAYQIDLREAENMSDVYHEMDFCEKYDSDSNSE
ncbi:predicted protein [Lichtheimia corymbifera JMRC:FSU:9682]|uniref:Heterokaryon incompatibility domain-containing protein n=1 Tax=Lichtheimia corymbifera JMRC:FSU:9682 TaxID=1263082 RepID=A0A068S850_9FUNG|nr:predicted protein [Lichtheimia corymbifera JMRC:FSU:9682]